LIREYYEDITQDVWGRVSCSDSWRLCVKPIAFNEDYEYELGALRDKHGEVIEIGGCYVLNGRVFVVRFLKDREVHIQYLDNNYRVSFSVKQMLEAEPCRNIGTLKYAIGRLQNQIAILEYLTDVHRPFEGEIGPCNDKVKVNACTKMPA
jgi:hypothetical protein